MRPGLVVLALVLAGCARTPEPRPEAPVAARTGAESAGAVPWSYAIVSDEASGEMLYTVIMYGRNALADVQPRRTAVPIDGVLVSIPSAEGALYVVDSSLTCHQAPLTRAEVKGFVLQQQKGSLRTSAVWKKLQPLLQMYKASD
jgi:hypothetical protein